MLENNRSKYSNVQVRSKDICRGIVYAMTCVQRYQDKSHSEGAAQLACETKKRLPGIQKYICGADGLEWVARAPRSLT